MTTGNTASIFTWQENLSGEYTNTLVASNTSVFSSCGVTGSMTSYGVGSTFSIGSTCDSKASFDTAILDTRIYRGNISYLDSNGNGLPINPTFPKVKQKLIGSQTNIYINISSLATDKLEGDVNSYITNSPLNTAINLGEYESKWVAIDTTLKIGGLNGTTTSYSDQGYFILDGWTVVGESHDLTNILKTENTSTSNLVKRFLTNGSQERIYFKTTGLASIEYSSGTGSSVSFSPSADAGYSNQYIQSVKVDTSQPTATYIFNYSTGSQSIVKYEFVEACNDKVYDIIFKNKWGVLETLSFSKKFTKSLSTTNSIYNRSIVDMNGAFNIQRHSEKQFNTNGYIEVTLNTEYLPEYMNTLYEELKLSEEIWLYDGVDAVPVNKSENDITFKSIRYDKLIQYTMKFKMSHRLLNNIL